ncbi:MAG: hypothetical protein AAGE80_06915 [Pseudomonadota bacterium]
MLDNIFRILSGDSNRAKAATDFKGLTDNQLADMGLHRSQIEALVAGRSR